MFLHLGGDVVIPVKDIVAIVDADARQKSETTAEFFRVAEEEGFVHPVGNEEPNAYVIARAEASPTPRVYPSPISSLTLKKRAGFMSGLREDNQPS